jgi:hypothetical protein
MSERPTHAGTIGPRRSVIVGWLVMGAAVAVPWMEWVRTGSAVRNSYEVFRSAQRLGLEELTPIRVLWFLLPVLAVAGSFFGVLGWYRWFAAVATFVGLVIGGAGLAVALSTAGAGAGPWSAVAIGVCALGVSIWLVREPQGGPSR